MSKQARKQISRLDNSLETKFTYLLSLGLGVGEIGLKMIVRSSMWTWTVRHISIIRRLSFIVPPGHLPGACQMLLSRPRHDTREDAEGR